MKKKIKNKTMKLQTMSLLVGLSVLASVSQASAESAITPAPASPIRVACVGDSITVSPVLGNAYPEKLQALLGTNWIVGNFGVGGRTLLRKGDYPYCNDDAFTRAQAFQPDVVVILLGANDTKPYNWKYHNEFEGDYTNLVNTFQNLASRPRIYLCRPTPVPEPGNYGINESAEQEEIKIIDHLVDTMKLGEIDLYTPLKDQPQLFPDRVHPNAEGAAAIAKLVYSHISRINFTNRNY